MEMRVSMIRRSKLLPDLSLHVRHANKSSFGERHVEQPGAGRESRAQPDVLHQQKWSHGPELIESQNEWKHPLELLAQSLVVESNRRKQVTAQRNSHARGHHHRGYQNGRFPSRQERFCDSLHSVQTKERGKVEDQVH